jgi:hypothetical protein
MADLVQHAMQANTLAGNARMAFKVGFISGDEKTGTIEQTGYGPYILMAGANRYYFNSESVVWICSLG